MLVLDEATGALDASMEAFIADRLRMRGCSCILVSHRLSTVRDCDEILVMENGRVVERGTHDELWPANSRYTELIRVTDDVMVE